MKIAIFHDYFRVAGGAEKLVLTLAQALNADIITSEYNQKVIESLGFSDTRIISLGEISEYSCFLPNECRKRFMKCNFSTKYDLFIFSGNFSIYAAKKHQPNIWYCHTPLRGLYETKRSGRGKEKTFYSYIVDAKKQLFKTRIIPRFLGDRLDLFFNNLHNMICTSIDLTKDAIPRINQISNNAKSDTRTNLLFFPFKFLRIFISMLAKGSAISRYNVSKLSDQRAVKSINAIIANSNNVRKRIKKYYNRSAQVINPPIECRDFKYRENGDFWLSVNRLTPEKRIELQVEAFTRLPKEKLIIVGGFDNCHITYAKKMMKKAPENITFTGAVDDNQLKEYYSNCKAFITTSYDEDFGMTPIEAMASGKPVIAPNEGGYRETVIHGKTGLLIDKINTQKLVFAISELSKDPIKHKTECIRQSKRFNKDIFIRKIRALLR